MRYIQGSFCYYFEISCAVATAFAQAPTNTSWYMICSNVPLISSMGNVPFNIQLVALDLSLTKVSPFDIQLVAWISV